MITVDCGYPQNNALVGANGLVQVHQPQILQLGELVQGTVQVIDVSLR